MGTLRVEHLYKSYGKVQAVRDVSFELENGQFLFLLGPSGCGKTTTLRCIAGLEEPDRGKIYIDGRDVTDVPTEERGIAMVFQTWALYPNMNVFNNIAFPLKLRKVPKGEISKRVKEVAEMLRIDNLLDRMPGELSGGESQRVALGRAIVREATIYCLDEPLTFLDALLRIQMRGELKLLQKKLGITVLMVTHDQVEATTMADKIEVMNAGRIIQEGTPKEIYENPQHTFVAGFVGAPPTNLIDGDIDEEMGEYYFDAGAFKYGLSKNFISAIRQAGRESLSGLTLGIRPERIKFTEKETNIKGVIEVVEYEGPRATLDVRVDGYILKAVCDIVEIPRSDRVYLDWDEKEVFLFDKSSGNRII